MEHHAADYHPELAGKLTPFGIDVGGYRNDTCDDFRHRNCEEQNMACPIIRRGQARIPPLRDPNRSAVWK